MATQMFADEIAVNVAFLLFVVLALVGGIAIACPRRSSARAVLFILAAMGAMPLVSRAGEEPGAAAEQATKEAAEESSREARKMVVRVQDEQGQPLAGANIHASVWEIESGKDRFPNRDYTTNDEGVAEIDIPRRLRILRLWATQAGRVPLFVNFAEKTHDDGRLIPNSFDFTLQPGHRIGGTVVDDEGKPIPGANVQVSVQVKERFLGANPQPIISTWLAQGGDAAVTDDQGRWEIMNAPAPREEADYEFHLQVTHRDFAGDTQWGELQQAQGITTAQLRAGTAKLKLDRGVSLAGTITGPDGKPVTKGLVIWNDRPYWAQGVNETQIDEAGHYETKRLAPGTYPITVVAPGFAPTQRKVQAQQLREPADFQLAAGRVIKIQIVNPQGEPVPKAYVSVEKWRGTEALYTHKHPNVPESGIPRRADENGVYTWDWAPADGVTYGIGAEGYASISETLVAKDEPHVVKLAPEMAIFGKVVDAESGEPVKMFRVIPVKAFRPDFYSTDYQANNVADGQAGQYRIKINNYGDTDDRYRVRIEAEGYRTAFGQKSLGLGEAPVQEDFRLEKAPAREGTVLDPQGKPVTEFSVAVGTPTTSPHFSLDRLETSFGIAFEVRGGNTFRLAATFEPSRIRVYNDAGFAEVLRAADEPLGTIVLQPWAVVAGRLMQEGQPIGNEWIYFRPLVQRGLTEARFQDSFAVKTEPDGQFRFERLPPMCGHVGALLGPWRESALTSSKSVPLDLQPGDVRRVLLGGEQATITGRVVATGRDNDALSKNWSLNYLVSRTRGVEYSPGAEPLGFDPAGPVQESWLHQPGIHKWLATRENYFVKLADDGRLRITGVEPGTYDLVFQIYEQPAGCLVETIGTKVMPLTISAEQATGEVPLGDIEIPCHMGPRVGASLEAYQFTDAEGRVRHVSEMSGRYLLFHVWASWCQPCLEKMPALKATVERKAEAPLTVVGLNIDKDSAAAKSLAEKGGWTWAQNYLGDTSDMMRQLGVSSVPAYYLVGPNGKLVGSSNSWDEVDKLLGTELR